MIVKYSIAHFLDILNIILESREMVFQSLQRSHCHFSAAEQFFVVLQYLIHTYHYSVLKTHAFLLAGL